MVRLTAKEIARADAGLVIIARPQAKGIKVMAVYIDGSFVGGDHPAFQAWVETSSEVGRACKGVARMLDKCGHSSDMTTAARFR